MTFGHPLLLLTLLVIPAGFALYRLLAARRRMRYAVRYTNVDVLAAVVATGRPWRRWLTAGAFLLAIQLVRGRTRPRVMSGERVGTIHGKPASTAHPAHDGTDGRTMAEM